jgi:hypothetical protein
VHEFGLGVGRFAAPEVAEGVEGGAFWVVISSGVHITITIC